jgi:RNA polymerase sigma-70 factor (ECF subfamily)
MDQIIRLARSGDARARETLLVAMRPRLRSWAEDALNSRFAGRMDASDLTQITLLDLHQKLEQFVGSTEGELVEWLRKALERNILDAVRHATALKRSVERERPMDDAVARDGIVGNRTVDDISTPSMQVMRKENADRLEKAIQTLLPDQQSVVRLVHLQGLPLSQAAQQLNRSTAAVAKLLQRGIKNLRTALAEEIARH